MTDALTFTVWGAAQPAGSKTIGRTKSGATFIRDSAKHGANWRQQVTQVAGQAMAGRALLTEAVRLTIEIGVVRPKGHFGKRGLLPSARPYPTTKPDTTKMVRAIEDALKGIVWRDDCLVVTQHNRKRYAEQAYATITVELETEP